MNFNYVGMTNVSKRTKVELYWKSRNVLKNAEKDKNERMNRNNVTNVSMFTKNVEKFGRWWKVCNLLNMYNRLAAKLKSPLQSLIVWFDLM